MDRILYSRLYDAKYDYAYYIPPQIGTNPLRYIVADQLMDTSQRNLFIWKSEDDVVFGVTEELPITDEGNRKRRSFWGLHLKADDVKNHLPYLNGLQSGFANIHQESLKLHLSLIHI